MSIHSFLFVLLSFLLISGCADKGAYQNYLGSHEKSADGYYEVAAKPLLDVTLPAPDGKEYKIVVNREVRPLVPQQIKDSEWTGAVTGGIVSTALVAAKGFDWKIKQSDNDAAVKMRVSDNEAQTRQLEDYVGNFTKEKEIIEIIEAIK